MGINDIFLTVISMWRNLQTVRKQRPSCQRLQTVSLPIAAAQCLKGQLSPCITKKTKLNTKTLPSSHQSHSSKSQYLKRWLLCSDLAYLGAGGIVKEVAVISMVGHTNVGVSWVTGLMRLQPLNPAGASLLGQRTPWQYRPQHHMRRTLPIPLHEIT